MGRPEKIRLGDILVGQKLITQDNLKIALDQQKRCGSKHGRALIQCSYVTDDKIGEAIARQLNSAFVNMKFYNTSQDLVRRLPETQARRFRAIVLEERGGKYLVGMSD